MFTGGAALEEVASRCARRELTSLVSRAPKPAHVRAGDELREVPVEALAVGDVVVVRTGEVVVATPCPLILAAPIALVSGLSRAARSGVIVKGADATEALGQARTVLFDKTGTLTVGTPDVREVHAFEGFDRGELLQLAASLDRLSTHVLGQALLRAATEAGLELQVPRNIHEQPGQGIAGAVADKLIAVGSRAFMLDAGVSRDELADTALRIGSRGSGEVHVFVAVGGAYGRCDRARRRAQTRGADDRRAAPPRGYTPRRDGLRRPPLGRRARRPRARR